VVKSKQYIPDCGDIVWLTFNLHSGHEQSGRRPALVISPLVYNSKTNLAIFCPITSQVKDYPFEVKLPEDLEISGVILSDQIKNLDWKSREAEYICKLPKSLLTETLNKINALLNI
jgi:mRNA interferase MazF